MGIVYSLIEKCITPFIFLSFNSILSEIYVYIKEKFEDFCFFRIKFNSNENFCCKQTILQILKNKNFHTENSTLFITDGIDGPNFEILNGIFKFKDNGISIIVNVSESEITIKTYKLYLLRDITDITGLKNYLDKKYKEFNSPSKTLMFFTSNGDRWNHPIPRKPIKIKNTVITPDMQTVLDSIDDFINNSSVYKNKGWHYHQGYLLYGEPGVGKSSIAELVAQKYNRWVYIITLNSKNMSDTVLINLFSSVQSNSIIIIDEIDKQLETVKSNSTVNISTAGLLMALDGPQRLDNGVIVILTSNKKRFLSKHEHKALTRPGRIDKVFKMTKCINAIALYNFTKQQPGDLSFKKDDNLIILSQKGNWWKAKLNNEEGDIPSNYVQLI